MGKIVKAVRPYSYNGNSNFKIAPYEAWKELGGECINSRLLERFYEGLSYHVDLPSLYCSTKEARLRFVEGACIQFDTFPDYLCNEIIPVIWDCWPHLFDKVAKWIGKHNVKTIFFTSSHTAEKMRTLYPGKNIYHLPEAIETELYKEGKPLNERKYDYLEFGRVCNYIDSTSLSSQVNVLSSRNESGALKTREMLIEALADSKITICLPRCVNQPEIAGDIETLTQRYWECMLSRVLIVGKAPKELIDIIGYDPVVLLDKENYPAQISDILSNIDNYQELVDRNRIAAIKHGDWKFRVKTIQKVLYKLGYKI